MIDDLEDRLKWGTLPVTVVEYDRQVQVWRERRALVNTEQIYQVHMPVDSFYRYVRTSFSENMSHYVKEPLEFFVGR